MASQHNVTPIDDAKKHGIPLPPVASSEDKPTNTNTPPSEPPQSGDAPPESGPKKFTIEEAFNFFLDPTGASGDWELLNIERATRAIAFLLHFCSEHGNQPVNGWTAHGLGHALELIADQAAQCFPTKD